MSAICSIRTVGWIIGESSYLGFGAVVFVGPGSGELYDYISKKPVPKLWIVDGCVGHTHHMGYEVERIPDVPGKATRCTKSC